MLLRASDSEEAAALVAELLGDVAQEQSETGDGAPFEGDPHAAEPHAGVELALRVAGGEEARAAWVAQLGATEKPASKKLAAATRRLLPLLHRRASVAPVSDVASSVSPEHSSAATETSNGVGD
eukprot:2798630-Prymnesium_polylepis.1